MYEKAKTAQLVSLGRARAIESFWILGYSEACVHVMIHTV